MSKLHGEVSLGVSLKSTGREEYGGIAERRLEFDLDKYVMRNKLIMTCWMVNVWRI